MEEENTGEKGIKESKCDFCDVKFLNKSIFTRHKKGVIKTTDSNDALFI
jgi:hypothetical protein